MPFGTGPGPRAAHPLSLDRAALSDWRTAIDLRARNGSPIGRFCHSNLGLLNKLSLSRDVISCFGFWPEVDSYMDVGIFLLKNSAD